MPGENIYDWSPTATLNANSDSLINWAEGQPRASVNNSARSMMAAHAKDRDLRNGSIVTGGTVNAQTFVSGYSFASIATIPSGIRVMLKIGPGLTNTGATTLNMDGLGAIPVKDEKAEDLTAGMLTAGGYGEFRYDGSNWVLLGASFTTIEVTNTTTEVLNVTDTATINTATINNLTVTGNETIKGTITLSDPASGLPDTGFSAALRITAWGDNIRYGIAIRLQLDNTRNIQFSNSVDTVIGSIDNQFGVQTFYNTASDGDLKTDIEDLPPVGAIIDRLRPVKFKWRGHPEAGDQSGFVAQETYGVAPQAVTPPRDGSPWMMDFSKLVPLLVAEVRSLRARVAALEAAR